MTNFNQSLISWYSQHKRDLPWRNSKDPYLIWVSEIILQQTRVNQGIDYYFRFTEQFPDINSLASADINLVLKVWQGLGYYSRARNMHLTANHIVNHLNGEFPKSFNELKKLKGIGDYTAAAIASFAFQEAVPVVDGNVYRVLARLFGIAESTQTTTGKKIFFEKAYTLIDKENPAEFNQAIMEFGSLQCTPTNPDCNLCPFKLVCFAYKTDSIDWLPIKKQKTKIRDRFFNYIYIMYNDQVFLEQRINNDIWKLLYQLPLIETNTDLTDQEIINHEQWKTIFKSAKIVIKPDIITKKHILSHQRIHARFYKVNINKPTDYLLRNYILTPVNELHKYSVPQLINNYFSDVNK